MKTTAHQLITSMAAHGDTDRLISECTDKADRIVTIGYDDTTTAFIFHFSDLSRVELDPHDGYIRAFGPSQHFA